MAPLQLSEQEIHPALTPQSKQPRGEVKVSVLNICGPFIIPTKAQPYIPADSSIPKHRQRYAVSFVRSEPVSCSSGTKETPSTTHQAGSCARGSLSQRLIIPFAAYQRVYPPGVSASLKECLIISPLQQQVQMSSSVMKTPEGGAVFIQYRENSEDGNMEPQTVSTVLRINKEVKT